MTRAARPNRMDHRRRAWLLEARELSGAGLAPTEGRAVRAYREYGRVGGPPQGDHACRAPPIEAAIMRACARAGITVAELQAGSRRRPLPAGRAEFAEHLVLAHGVSIAAISKSLRKATA